MKSSEIKYLVLTQEDLVDAGAFDLLSARRTVKESLIKYRDGKILFPDKIVQIFNEETQERINCLPATLLEEKICGMKWVSVFPPNPRKHGVQNLSAITLLSEIETGFPVCVMDATLCSNIRVAAVGATAAEYLAREDSETIGFIGAGEQAKMHLLGMKSVRPRLKLCKVAAKEAEEERAFIRDLQPLLPDMEFKACNTVLKDAIIDADIIVTGTSAQAPLLKADWVQTGAFYSHIGGWEDEYAVVKKANKIVCDDWSIVKHRTQTLSRCYKDGVIGDNDIHGNLIDIITGKIPARENNEEFIYFNAVGLSYLDVALAYSMYAKALSAGVGTWTYLQKNMIFEKELTGKVIF